MESTFAFYLALFMTGFSGLPFVSGTIHEKLHYFETLKVSDITHRTRRSIDPNAEAHLTEVQVSTLGRNFHLYLKQSRILSPGFKASLVGSNGKSEQININGGNSYSGQVKGDSYGVADVSYDETGSMLANIVTKEDIYIIEPSWRLLPHSDNHTMVAYRKSDVKFETTDSEQNRRRTCGIHAGGNIDDELHGRILVKDDNLGQQTERPRNKRQSASQYLGPRTTCQMMIVADYTFFENMGGSSASQTASYMIHIIQYINTIYRKTQFDSQGGGMTNVGFEIGELRIHNESTSYKTQLQGRTHYNIQTDYWDTKDLLEAFSAEIYLEKFCLAHLFTYRKFSQGVLGLAYIASDRRSAVGGLCSPLYSKYPGSKLSLNTGWSSSRNTAGNRILALQAQLVTAHELGHNLGSEHDPETDDCAPSERDDGKYIMYPWAVDGYDKNNLLFSPCSREYIFQVLKAKGYDCLIEGRGDGAFCGNGRIDKGETCDGGWNTKNDLDPCCDPDCQLRPGKKCSPMNYGCCTETCQPAGPTQVCRPAIQDSCLDEVKCDGKSMTCPNVTSFKRDDTPCIDQGICKKGVCLNYCEMFDIELKPCICGKAKEACHRCCKGKTGEEECRSINETFLPDGRTCFQGYCQKGECVKQSTDMVQRLFDIIEKLTPSTFVQFMKSNIVGTVIIFSLLVWIPASCTISFIDRKKARRERASRNWLSRSNRTLLLDEENLRVRRLANPRVPRHIAGSVVRHTDHLAASAPPEYGHVYYPERKESPVYYPPSKEDHSYQPSGIKGEDSYHEKSKGGDTEQPQPRRRPPLMRFPEIPAPLASIESMGSRLSGASEGFDIGPDMVHPDSDDHETVV